MGNAVASLVVDESKWLSGSMAMAAVAVAWLLYRCRREEWTSRATICAAMNLFFATTIGTMAVGHLLAVTVKYTAGTLDGTPSLLYVIGGALAVPSWWLAHQAVRLSESSGATHRALLLNAWTGGTLLAMGLHNLPLAAPAILNILYARQSHPFVGHALVTIAILLHAGLFIGALVFAASGQSFEQLRGLE